jgi:hypothetical protein
MDVCPSIQPDNAVQADFAGFDWLKLISARCGVKTEGVTRMIKNESDSDD